MLLNPALQLARVDAPGAVDLQGGQPIVFNQPVDRDPAQIEQRCDISHGQQLLQRGRSALFGRLGPARFFSHAFSLLARDDLAIDPLYIHRTRRTKSPLDERL